MDKKTFSQILRKEQTDTEKLLWNAIRNRKLKNTKFRRQHIIEPYVVDFVSLKSKLIIELDGGNHNKKERKMYDKRRTTFLEGQGYKVIRFWNNDILNSIDEVLKVILFNLNQTSS